MFFCHLLIFFKIDTFEKFLQEYQQYQAVSNSLDPDEPPCFGEPESLQRLSADRIGRQKHKLFLLKKVIVDYYKLVTCWEFVSLIFLSADFFAHLSRRLNVSYCDQSSSAVCRP